MQDHYIGDIGDYGKYGLLRVVCAEMSLAVNWYRVAPAKLGKQDDGKYIGYLSAPQQYRDYDSDLFDALHRLVLQKQDRRIEGIEQEKLFRAICYSAVIDAADRKEWHRLALEQTKAADVVFLDPDNGLETFRMHQTGGATEKHVKWTELKDYYARGQNVILYQHRPQMTKKEKCIEDMMAFQRNYLLADCVKLLEFPKYTNRFYFMFLHEESRIAFERICCAVVQKWGKNDFCRVLLPEQFG